MIWDDKYKKHVHQKSLILCILADCLLKSVARFIRPSQIEKYDVRRKRASLDAKWEMFSVYA